MQSTCRFAAICYDYLLRLFQIPTPNGISDMCGLRRLLPFLILFASPAFAHAEEKRESVVGRRIPHFVLPDAAGKQVGLSDFKENQFLIVAFLGTKCPVGNAYIPVLLDLQKQYREKKVQIIGINANPGETAETIAKHVKDFSIAFPILIDAEQSVLQLFGAKRTPEVFVLDDRGTIRYRGRIDDRYAPDHKRDEPKRNDLREALDELLAGKKVSVPETEAAGCLISRSEARKKKNEVTYAKHVAVILHKQCAGCHHPGTAAPFSLLTYDDASNSAEMIREVVTQRRMPPWSADSRFGHFSNERRLTADEIDTIAAWVEGGSVYGDKKDEPAPPAFAEGWRIGKPDVVFEIPKEFTVPAQGKVKYQYFTTKTNLTEDVWVQAIEPRPGNRAVVHHIIVSYKDPKNKLAPPVWVASVAPGEDPVVFAKGYGRKIPAGAELIWQIHYTPTGKEEKDRSQVGLVFCKEPPKFNVVTHGAANRSFTIPAGASSHEVVSTVPVQRDTMLLAFHPHAHLRGKDFQYEVIYPDKRKEVLLSVPQYDFSWQHIYRLKEPLSIPKGSVIRCVAHYDNSAANPANPDPTKDIRWGDQTWDEMMIGYIDYYWADGGK
jgi:peroxiredoxin/mono/diheme cytochrome c family protein